LLEQKGTALYLRRFIIGTTLAAVGAQRERHSFISSRVVHDWF
jgi:hypothetical protein